MRPKSQPGGGILALNCKGGRGLIVRAAGVAHQAGDGDSVSPCRERCHPLLPFPSLEKLLNICWWCWSASDKITQLLFV